MMKKSRLYECFRELTVGASQYGHIFEWASEQPNRTTNCAVGFGGRLTDKRDRYSNICFDTAFCLSQVVFDPFVLILQSESNTVLD